MFIIGVQYERSDLLEFVGSRQPQSGIIWGPTRSDCAIVTSGGRHGRRVGYADTRLPDGTWLYHGQGERGDQDPGRFSNALLAEGDRTVLLFTTREPTAAEIKERQGWAKVYTFEGNFRVAAWDFVVPIGGTRAGDKLVVFRLAPEIPHGLSPRGIRLPPKSHTKESLRSLRAALLAESFRPAQLSTSTSQYYVRSEQVHQYALQRAEGRCESCGREAPFLDEDGSPFLEVHHITRLSDGGPDHVANVAAVCPNCHREAHHGERADELNRTLLNRIRAKEECFGATWA